MNYSSLPHTILDTHHYIIILVVDWDSVSNYPFSSNLHATPLIKRVWFDDQRVMLRLKVTQGGRSFRRGERV